MFCTSTSGQSSRHTVTSTSPPLTLTPATAPTLSLLSPSSCTPFVYTPPPTPPTMTLFFISPPTFSRRCAHNRRVSPLIIGPRFRPSPPPESQPFRPRGVAGGEGGRLVAPPPLTSGVMTLFHRFLLSQPSTLHPRPLTRHRRL